MSAEQQNRFGLRGYVAAYILPDGFEPKCGGVEIASQGAANYACITICDPFSRAFEYIPTAYKKILEYLKANGFKENVSGEYLSCFEYVYEKMIPLIWKYVFMLILLDMQIYLLP